MIHYPRMPCVCLFALMLSVVAGCGAKPVPVAEVSGVLMVDGKPTPEIAIDFVPDSEKGTSGPFSSALTDQEGKFHLVCRDGRSGAVVGIHRVVLQDNRSVAGAPSMRFAGKDKDGPIQKPLPSSRIPDRFTKALSTPLRQEVKPEPQSITLQVTKK